MMQSYAHTHTHTKRTNRFSFVNLQACRCLFAVSNPTLYYETDMILSQRLRTCRWPMGVSKMDEKSSQQKSKAVESSAKIFPLSPTETQPRVLFSLARLAVWHTFFWQKAPGGNARKQPHARLLLVVSPSTNSLTIQRSLSNLEIWGRLCNWKSSKLRRKEGAWIMGDMLFEDCHPFQVLFLFLRMCFSKSHKFNPRTFPPKSSSPKIEPKKNLSLGIPPPHTTQQPTTGGHGCLVPKASPFVALPRDDLRRRSPLRGAPHTWMLGEFHAGFLPRFEGWRWKWWRNENHG